ncbi:MAG: lytic murein transglycosylase [Alphaproteobacteria bacterium]|nr:lytic murein transglycosylase [Alphaproteobacteria bacterium]
MMTRIRTYALAVVLGALAAGPAGAGARLPPIDTSDVARFYRVYDAAGRHPGAEALARDYLAPGSAALHDFARLRRVSGTSIAQAIAARPQIYVGARRCLAVLPDVKRRLRAALGKLVRLYPEAKLAPITFVVGHGKPVGITDPAGVTMGLEALCAADFMDPNLEDRFVHTIAHEYGHIEQPADVQALEQGQPGATVLRLSLIEGVGEFTAKLISGGVGEYRPPGWMQGQAAAVDRAFVRDEDKTSDADIARWLYNGPGPRSDLGYWVGYRIVQAYYDHAADKHQALRDIYGMRHPHRFVARSGWTPGG